MNKLIRTQSKDVLVNVSSIDYIRIIKEYDESLDKMFYEIEASVNEQEVVELGRYTTERYAQIELIRILTSKFQMHPVATEEEIEYILNSEKESDSQPYSNLTESQYTLVVYGENKK